MSTLPPPEPSLQQPMSNSGRPRSLTAASVRSPVSLSHIKRVLTPTVEHGDQDQSAYDITPAAGTACPSSYQHNGQDAGMDIVQLPDKKSMLPQFTQVIDHRQASVAI